jgi:anti-sigma B factor antagonist
MTLHTPGPEQRRRASTRIIPFPGETAGHKPLVERNQLDAVYRMPKMYRVTKYMRGKVSRFAATGSRIYLVLTIPKQAFARLSLNMQTMNTNSQTWMQPPGAAAFELNKEPKLKLSLETRNHGDVIIVHCQGRIVYRDEAAALSRLVSQALQSTSRLVLDLSGVSSMDSAGIGELALMQSWAQGKGVNFKCAGPNDLVRTLLDLTNLDSVLEIHASVDDALESFVEERVTADC